MLTFPADWFLDEVRDGFYVSGMMKRAWAAELEMLDVLARFLDERGLKWYADYGTLLGAVRHGGFIPWDDDIDLTMPREDYMRFLEEAPNLPAPFRVLSFYNTETFTNFHAILKNTLDTKLAWDDERCARFHGCPFIIDLDIFPLDYQPRDKDKDKVQRIVYTFGYKLVQQRAKMEAMLAKGEAVPDAEQADFDKDFAQFKAYLARFFGDQIVVDETKPLLNALCLASDAVAMACRAEEADVMDHYAHIAYREEPILRDKAWYAQTVSLPFEVTQIHAPAVYTAVLKKRFGAEYMRQRRESSTHDYPFFAGQDEYFRYIGRM